MQAAALAVSGLVFSFSTAATAVTVADDDDVASFAIKRSTTAVSDLAALAALDLQLMVPLPVVVATAVAVVPLLPLPMPVGRQLPPLLLLVGGDPVLDCRDDGCVPDAGTDEADAGETAGVEEGTEEVEDETCSEGVVVVAVTVDVEAAPTVVVAGRW